MPENSDYDKKIIINNLFINLDATINDGNQFQVEKIAFFMGFIVNHMQGNISEVYIE